MRLKMVHTERSLQMHCSKAAGNHVVRLVGFEICAGSTLAAAYRHVWSARLGAPDRSTGAKMMSHKSLLRFGGCNRDVGAGMGWCYTRDK
jgi:hypothetical protein